MNSLLLMLLFRASASAAGLTADSLPAPEFSRGQLVKFQDGSTYIYKKPVKLAFIRYFHGDLGRYAGEVFHRDYLRTAGLVLASTVLLVAFDQAILDETQRFGRKLGLTGNNKLKPVFSIAGFPIEMPHDPDTWLYFIGDGWLHTGIAAGFLGIGLVKNDNRALQTASQLVEGMLTNGFTTQLLKHITGRESPFRSTRDGGRWDFFPNQIDYHKNVPSYDAFPSGHLATAMMTVTVIAENYPGNRYVRPIGYSLMTLLSFQMVNNGVHWVSDYPLALAMGYSFAKIAVRRGRTLHQDRINHSRTRQIGIQPVVSGRRIGIQLTF